MAILEITFKHSLKRKCEQMLRSYFTMPSLLFSLCSFFYFHLEAGYRIFSIASESFAYFVQFTIENKTGFREICANIQQGALENLPVLNNRNHVFNLHKHNSEPESF